MERSMSEPTARQRRSEERRRQILDAARERADADGWAAVTTRHLADAIGYSQPVLYGHFPGGKTEIMRAVAFEGFVELRQLCDSAATDRDGREAIEAVANAYLDFGAAHPAVYEAMFQQPIDTRFASDDTEPELRAGFNALARVVAGDGEETRTEVFWAALHGISQLERAGRMPPQTRRQRVNELGTLYSRASLDR
jgi:AcrR family transcriptional regulator